jgi:transcriptional regulator with XRE-family HTH domain
MEELRKERIRQGLSLEALGEISGYHGNHIWSLETGKSRAKIDIVSDLAQALGMKLKLERGDE